MSDPWDDQLRQALASTAREFGPTNTVGATRAQLLGRIRRRRQATSLAVVAAAIVVVASLLVSGIGRSGSSPGQRVAAGGKGGTSTTAPLGASAGVPGDSTDPGRVSVNPGGVVTSPGGGTVATGVPTTPPSTASGGGAGTTVPSTAPSTTVVTPSTTVATVVPTSVSVALVAVVRGTVTYVTSCPAGRNSATTCVAHRGPAHIELLNTDGSVAAAGNAGSGGAFAITVAPGTYAVHATTIPTTTAAAALPCTATPNQVTASSGSGSAISVSCLAAAP